MPNKFRSALAGSLMLVVITGCGGGGGGSRDAPVTPPPVADPMFSVSLDSVSATDRSSNNALPASGGPVSGATATLQ